MKKQRYIVEIEMPDGDFISAGWLKDLIQTDCDVEDEGRKKVTVQETYIPSNLDEAANDYCSAYYDWDDEGERKEVVRTFKAGAEWMAGQGVTKEAVITRAAELTKDLAKSGLDEDSIPYHLIEFMCNLYTCPNWKEIEETAEAYVTRIKAAAMKDLPRWKKPAEWSEEDEFFRQQLIVYCEKCVPDSLAAKCVDWLKSLRPQPHWKPSEYTLSLIKRVANGEMLTCIEQMAMGTLHEQLKKLKPMRPKYEYVIKETGHVTESELNYYGKLGWELVQVLPEARGIIKMIFKREKEEQI